MSNLALLLGLLTLLAGCDIWFRLADARLERNRTPLRQMQMYAGKYLCRHSIAYVITSPLRPCPIAGYEISTATEEPASVDEDDQRNPYILSRSRPMLFHTYQPVSLVSLIVILVLHVQLWLSGWTMS